MSKTTKVGNPRTLAPEIRELTEVYYSSLNSPRSLTCAILLRYDEFDQLARIRATPSDYGDAAAYHLAASASDWLRKYPGLPVKVDPEVAAKRSWYQSEEECKRTNVRALIGLSPEEVLLFDVAAEFVKDVLGPCPLDLTPRFGPGATVSDVASATTVLDKVTSQLTLTEGAKPFLTLWEGTAWERSHISSDLHKKSSYEPKTVKGNTFFTVPKTALTKRGCAKGPSLNVAYQLAVGNAMRSRFKTKLAYDLSHGQTHHNELARIGSLYGTYATLDSERASDTMAFSIVSILLSKSGFWPDLFKSLREETTWIDGAHVPLEKFSAMGNGFTFELETLVFMSLCYAAAWAHGEENFPAEYAGLSPLDLIRIGHISVYGDDVIVPAFLAEDMMAILALAGFTVNKQKSFIDGSFRESCGGDYFNGVAVRTAKLTKEPSEPADWFSVHNLVKSRFVDEYPMLNGNRVLLTVKNNLPRQYRSMYGPTFLGDQVLHGWYGPNVRHRARITNLGEDPNQWVATFKVVTPILTKARLSDYDPEAQLAYALYSFSSEPPMRRPTKKLRYRVVDLDLDYHVAYEDYVPRAPAWIAKSRYASQFGIRPDGSYVS